MTALLQNRSASRVFFAVGLLLSAEAAAQTASTPLVPGAAEQDRLLGLVRRYAEKYVSNLPDFLCVQTTRQFEAGKKATHWHEGDSLTFKLVFNEGREDRNLELVNDKPLKPGVKAWRTPLTSEGEFGLLLSSVFAPQSEASFSWSRWDEREGKRLAVFDYSIDRAHSTLKLSLSDLSHAVVPYHGSVAADLKTGAIWRITSKASDIPSEIQTRSIATTIGYDEMRIGGQTYLLPALAIVLLELDHQTIRNEIQFSEYRKFEANSSITYTPGAAGQSGPPISGTVRPPNP